VFPAEEKALAFRRQGTPDGTPGKGGKVVTSFKNEEKGDEIPLAFRVPKKC